MKVVVALDSFKGSASARQAADAVAAGWRLVSPRTDLHVVALADGGEGTIDALATAPRARRHYVDVPGPHGGEVRAHWLELDAPQRTGVVELAVSSGITLMPTPAPMDAGTRGMGEVMVAALDSGIARLLVAVGGSASTDGGAGVLSALGARLLDGDGVPIAPGGRGLASLATIDASGLRRPPVGGVVVLADVVNPLTGPHGAAAVYGPQKGANASQVIVLDDALAHFSDVARRELARWAERPLQLPSAPRAGAAGGAAYGLSLWGAELASGAAAIADAAGLDAALAGARLVVTGEGRFDSQTAHGKVVSEVLRRARTAGVPAALVAGQVAAPTDGFAHIVSLAQLAGGARHSLADPMRWLRSAGGQLARACA